MRLSEQKLNPSLKNQLFKTFAQTLTDFGKLEDTQNFLRDFFTDTEVETFAKRLAVGYWLTKNRSYTNIRDNLKVSSATIAEVAGKYTLAGFKLAIKKIEAEEWANKWAERIRKITS